MMKNQPEEKVVFTIKEVADYLGLHPGTIYRLARDGSIPAFKIGSDWRFNRESIDRWRLEAETHSRPGRPKSR